MVYRTEKDALNSSVGTDFSKSRFKPVYRYNKATDELELTDEVIDLQECIDSCRDSALNAILERFLPTETVDEISELRDEYADDLDFATEMLDKAEYYREKFNLPTDMSVTEIFNTLNTKLNDLNNRIKENNNQNGEEKNEKTENN